MYCRNCGERFNPVTDKFCSKCGASFYLSPPKAKRRSLEILYWGLVLIVVGILSPFVLKWLLGPCGVVPVSSAIKRLDEYAAHLVELENGTVNNKKPSSHFLAQIDGDIISMDEFAEDVCANDAMLAANRTLTYASIYFSDLPTFEMTDARLAESYGRFMVQRRHDYENALRDFYGEVGKLKACQPFCNIDTLFEFEEFSGYE